MKRSLDSTVNIATLKAQLSKYMRLVKSGRAVLVTDRQQYVARIVPYQNAVTLETIKPTGSFSELAQVRIESVRGHGEIDTLAYLLEERQKR